MEVGWETASRTATHPLSATAHGRVAGSVSPPARFVPIDQYTALLYRGSLRAHVYAAFNVQLLSTIKEYMIYE